MCAHIFVVSMMSFAYPSAANLICPGISALTDVIRKALTLPSTPALIWSGTEGKSFLNSSGTSAIKRNRSCLPMSAIILAEILPSLSHIPALACIVMYESVVFSSKPEIFMPLSFMFIFPSAEIISIGFADLSVPQLSFILK